MRRSLVLTDDAARHPFRATLPPHVRRAEPPQRVRNKWALSKADIRGFASAYFACLVAMLVLIA